MASGQLDVNGRTQKSDQFGLSVTCGDFDADGYDEVAIGVPTDTINGQADAGSVHILCGTAAGLSRFGDQVWHRNRAFVNGNAQPDRFGFALTSGDFDGDGHADLAVGAPNDLVSGVGGAGSAQVLLSPTRTSMRCRTMVR